VQTGDGVEPQQAADVRKAGIDAPAEARLERRLHVAREPELGEATAELRVEGILTRPEQRLRRKEQQPERRDRKRGD
jgi:hypothetical protein